MSLSITLTTDDTSKLISTTYLLDMIASHLGSELTMTVPNLSGIAQTFTQEEIKELSSWFSSIVQILRYNNYDVDFSNDEDYLASLTA